MFLSRDAYSAENFAVSFLGCLAVPHKTSGAGGAAHARDARSSVTRTCGQSCNRLLSCTDPDTIARNALVSTDITVDCKKLALEKQIDCFLPINLSFQEETLNHVEYERPVMKGTLQSSLWNLTGRQKGERHAHHRKQTWTCSPEIRAQHTITWD